MTEPTTKRRPRRTNAEILADNKAKEAAKVRARRTKQAIAKDVKIAEEVKQEVAAIVNPPHLVKTVTFAEPMYVLHKDWAPYETVVLTEDSPYYELALDRNRDLIFNKTPDEQREAWGRVKYFVGEIDVNTANAD